MLCIFASNIYLPAVNSMAADLNTTVGAVSVGVSLFTIGLALGAIVWGPLADQVGRRPAYAAGLLICVLSSIGGALTSSFPILLIMRLLQGMSSSAGFTVGAGSISDIFEVEERGTAMGIFFSGQMLGPVLGTILGAILSEHLGWRWTFWIIVILAGAGFIVMTFMIPETLRVAVARKRQMPLKGLPYNFHLQPPPRFTFQNMNIIPVLPALRLPYVFIPMLNTSLGLGSYYAVNVAISVLLARDYHYSVSTIGMCYIAIGAGSITGALVGGIFAERSFLHRLQCTYDARDLEDIEAARAAGTEKRAPRPLALEDYPFEARLKFQLICAVILPLSVAGYGWAMYYRVHIAVPLVCEFFVGFSVISHFGVLSTYLVDTFTLWSSSMMALANMFRYLSAALWAGVIVMVMDAWGTQWAFTFLGFLCMVSTILTFVLYFNGQKWRRMYPPTMYLEAK
ncbi:Dityrosine transporter 1 [Tieghemiomyces parasiticus]|uniref:Dityrosine transporter 1 n=1 Tax=Tieghemiomyces parasiticus TaxID=78921 RepID=A0A9W8AAG9_9FUNG|nr:Dityrosine transporter 1 [Tieghemiomyces parasiticus]